MTDLIGDNAFFATLYFTNIPVNHNHTGEYRHENRKLAKYISNLFDASESDVVESRGVERAILSKEIQAYDKGLESTIIPKVYTCSNRVVIAVDEELKSQRALSTYELADLSNLMKFSSEKRRALCDMIYNTLLVAGCTKEDSLKEYFCDINAFETQREKDTIIDEIVAGGNVNMHRDRGTEDIGDACSILSSTGTEDIDNILAIYKNDTKIPLRCSTIKTSPNNRVVTMLTVSRAAASAAGLIEKEYIIQTE